MAHLSIAPQAAEEPFRYTVKDPTTYDRNWLGRIPVAVVGDEVLHSGTVRIDDAHSARAFERDDRQTLTASSLDAETMHNLTRVGIDHPNTQLGSLSGRIKAFPNRKAIEEFV